MRRTGKLPFVGLLLFVFNLSVVQQSYGQGQLGLRGGVNVSKLGKGDRFSWRPSWHIGGYCHVSLNTKTFLQPELLYSSEAYTDNFNLSAIRRDVSFNHLSIPVLFGYNLSKNLSVVIGPEVSCLLYAGVNQNQKLNVTSSYSKFTYGIDAGVNYRISKRIGIDVRYNYYVNGLKQYYIEYYTDGTRNVIGYSTFKSRVLQVGLQYNF